MEALRTSLTVGFLIAFGLVHWVQAGEPVEDLLAATFRVTDGDHSGSAFLVSVPDFGLPGHDQILLVTAKHILEQMNGDECELHLRTADEENAFSREIVTLRIRDQGKRKWLQHSDVDVAVLPIELPEKVAAKPIAFDQIADETSVKDRLVRVGQESWVACFPAKLESNDAGWPVLRKGTIASYPLLPVKTMKTMLVDYSVFGGDSGAPVAVIVNGKLLIVGVASSMQRQTDRSILPFEERVMHIPLGISIVVQADYLKEMISFMKPQ